MDANKRSEANNQTNNGGNEKWTPGARGNTTTGPMDHTYPQGASRQQGQQDKGVGTIQSGMGPGGHPGGGFGRTEHTEDLEGGSMQTQQTGGSGPVQGITDSHQQAMEHRSEAWGELEQPVGHRPAGSGTSLQHHPANRAGHTQATERMNPQDPAQPELQGGSLGSHHGAAPGSYQGGPRTTSAQHSSGPLDPPVNAPDGRSLEVRRGVVEDESQLGVAQPGGPGSKAPSAQRADAGNVQESMDREGSQTGAQGREQGVHKSNYSAGGLPRAPGNSGPAHENPHWRPGQSMQNAPDQVHKSNDATGGLPRSPAANKLSGSEKMDDDTGFSRKP